MKNKILLVWLLLPFALLTACAPTDVIRARAGENFTITLASNPTTGYNWQLAQPLDEKIVRLVGSEYLPARTGLIGSGGEEKWSFLAVNKGATRVLFKYTRPWEKNTPPAKEKSFLVRIE
jgi:inhibitor of cysteine peptidase